MTEPPPPYALALVLATGDPPRMYSGLSLLVSTAAEGSRCAVLATFRGLELRVENDRLRMVEEMFRTALKRVAYVEETAQRARGNGSVPH